MAAAPGRMIHAGMQGIATGEGSLTAVGTEIAIMTTMTKAKVNDTLRFRYFDTQ